LGQNGGGPATTSKSQLLGQKDEKNESS